MIQDGATRSPAMPILRRFSSSFFASLYTMITYKSQKSEIFWHGLLNRSEARVLSSVEERKLLVELVDCKTRSLTPCPGLTTDVGRVCPPDRFPTIDPRPCGPR